jgi:SMC interacting uncharacterized protein involved in chromosome segregation
MKLLIASFTRRAVVKSGLRSDRRRERIADRSKATSRSTIAPAAMRPDVGTPLVTEAACPCAAKPLMVIWPWRTA